MDRTVETDTADVAGDPALEHGSPVYRQCASCGAPIKLTPILPRNTQGGILWSDGYLDTPDAREPPILGKCRVCDAIGCLPDLPEMEAVAQPAPRGDYAFVPLTVSDYASLLDDLQEISEQFHVYLRIRFWQLNNHRRRGSDDVEPLSEIERANLEELLELLGEEDAERLIKAEILRQLQQFEGAEGLLAEPVAQQLTPIVQRLRQLLEDREAGLVKIFSGEPGDEIPPFLRR